MIVTMSMYASILQAALTASAHPPRHRGSSDAPDGSLAELLRLHRQLLESEREAVVPGGATSALAHQLEYDIALIELVRSLGIACDPAEFDRPERRRRQLERMLNERVSELLGSPLGEADGGDEGDDDENDDEVAAAFSE